MRNENFYTVIQVDNGDDVRQVSDTLRRLSANTYIQGDKISVFCSGAAGPRASKVKTVCHRYKTVQTA